MDEGLLSLGPELTALEEERALYTERLQQLAVLQVEGEEMARRWQEHCRILGPQWDAERVQEFDTSLATRAQVENHITQLRRLEDELAQARFRLEQPGRIAKLEEGSRGTAGLGKLPGSPGSYRYIFTRTGEKFAGGRGNGLPVGGGRKGAETPGRNTGPSPGGQAHPGLAPGSGTCIWYFRCSLAAQQ